MKRIISVLAVIAVMAALLAASAMPAFAAKPSSFKVECQNASGTSAFADPDNGRDFGQANKETGKSGAFRGNECQRTIQ